MALPSLVAHADWSVDAEKRAVAHARLGEDGTYTASAPRPVGDATRLLDDLREKADGGTVLVGFDYPIGVPRRWAEEAGVATFTEFLREVGEGRWTSFTEVADAADDVSVTRPFYPASADGSPRRSVLTGALDLDWSDLYRRCDRAARGGRDASPLFWTLGPQQVGRAALHGWEAVLQPAVEDGAVIWPFDGDLPDLLETGRDVLVEAYPAAYHESLGVELDGGKRHQHHRRTNGPALRTWARNADVTLGADLRFAIDDGFGRAREGQHAFDAVIGLFGILDALTRDGSGFPDDDPAVRRVEGWIFGRPEG